MNERYLPKRMLAFLGLGGLFLLGIFFYSSRKIEGPQSASGEKPEERKSEEGKRAKDPELDAQCWGAACDQNVFGKIEGMVEVPIIGGPQSYMDRGGELEAVGYFFVGHLDGARVGDDQLNVAFSTKTGNIRPLVLKRAGDHTIGTDKVFLYEPFDRDSSAANGPKPRNLCQGQRFPIPGGPADAFDGKAVAIPGHWGREPSDGSPKKDGAFTLSCASGVVAKCILRGYVPSDKEPSKNDLLLACLYASRSQPNKEGTAHTCNGTIIDIYDEKGIQPIDPSLPASYTFEAAWNQDGLVCMNHPRYSGCAEALPKVPKCPDDVAQGNNWSALDKRILIKTRSVMVEGACPNTLEGILNVCNPEPAPASP